MEIKSIQRNNNKEIHELSPGDTFEHMMEYWILTDHENRFHEVLAVNLRTGWSIYLEQGTVVEVKNFRCTEV